MPGARKTSAAAEGGQNSNAWLDQVEYEPYYPKIILEQRMNHHIHFRDATPEFSMTNDLNDFSYDLDAQLNQLTHVSQSE